MRTTQNQYHASSRSSWRAGIIGAIVLALGAVLHGQQYTLAPAPYQYVITTAFAVVPNGCVWTYAAGTTTPIATYADTSGTLNGNPIIADNYGRFTAYLLPGTNYKFQYENVPCASPATHGATIKTQDNIQGVPTSAANVDVVGTAGESLTAGQCVYLSDGSGSKTQGQWYKCDSANTYSSTLPVVGIPIASIALASTGTIRTDGYVTGLSSLTVGAPYFVASVAGNLTATAPANRRLVGVADTTTTLIIAPNPAVMVAAASGTASATTFLRGDQTWTATTNPSLVISTTSTGTQNDFAPGISAVPGQLTILRCNNASLLTINGFGAPLDGARLLLVSIGAGQVDLAHQNASSSAANRMINFATSGATSLAAGSGTAEYAYDATTARWRLVAHDQGAWITPTFDNTKYTGIGSMTWTLAAGDVTTQAYWLKGRTLTVAWYLITTTVGGTAAIALQIANGAWGGYTAAKSMGNAMGYTDNSGTAWAVGHAFIAASGTQLQLYKVDFGVTNWTLSTDLNYQQGTFSFEVQ